MTGQRTPPQTDGTPREPRLSDSARSVDFSLVLPCFNEAQHLSRSVKEVFRVLEETGLSYEIILVDDGSTDATVDVIRACLREHPEQNARAYFHDTNQGRGATVSEGIRRAHGTYVGFLDVDLEVHPCHIPSALAILQQDSCDIVVGSRIYQVDYRTLHRVLISVLYRRCVRFVLGTPRFDTECGFKFFRRDVILPVLSAARDPYWFWDTEITILAHDHGLRIRTLPVPYVRNPHTVSTVRVLRDSWRSLRCLLAFAGRRRARRLQGLASQEPV